MAGPYAADPEFVEYVRARQRTLLRAAYLVCGDAHLAEDLLQGALVKLALRWEKVRGEHPDAYVRQILYRDAVSSWRQRGRGRELVVPVEALPDTGAPRGATAEDRAVLGLDLERALSLLTPKQRAVVVLRYFEDRTEAQTAEVLGVSVGTVKSQSHAAIRALRTVLADYDLPHPGPKGPSLREVTS